MHCFCVVERGVTRLKQQRRLKSPHVEARRHKIRNPRREIEHVMTSLDSIQFIYLSLKSPHIERRVLEQD